MKTIKRILNNMLEKIGYHFVGYKVDINNNFKLIKSINDKIDNDNNDNDNSNRCDVLASICNIKENIKKLGVDIDNVEVHYDKMNTRVLKLEDNNNDDNNDDLLYKHNEHLQVLLDEEKKKNQHFKECAILKINALLEYINLHNEGGVDND